MSIQEQVVGSILIPTLDTTKRYTVNFFLDLGGNGDRLTVSSLATPLTIKIAAMSLRKDAVTATGTDTVGPEPLDSEAGAQVISLPAYTTSEPIQLDRLIDYLEVTTQPDTADGIVFTLFRSLYDGKMLTSDYVY